MPENLRDRAATAAAARAERTANGETTTSTPDPAATVAKVDVAKQLVDAVAPEIEKQLPRQIKPEAFLRVILTGLKSSKQAKQLAKCTRPSLWAAMLEAARYGLMPFTDEGAIVPFGDTATFIPQYQGLIQIMYRTGQVNAVTVNLIHEFDDWDIEYGTNARFYHKPRFTDDHGKPANRGEPILAYCYVTLRSGGITTPTFVTRDGAVEVMQKYSRSWANAERSWNGKPPKRDSTWHTDFPAMWMKTAVRQHAKFAPKSPELVELLLAEARDDIRRADATPAPTWTPEDGEGRGIDWSTDDMNGAVPGEVIHDEPAAGDAAGDAGEDDGWPDGAQPTVPRETADGRAVNADGELEKDTGGKEKVTRSTAGRIGQIFQKAGWTGDEYAARRLAMVGVMTDLAAVPPVQLDSPMGMTEAQGRAAEANLNDLIAKAGQAKRDPAEVLQALYERLTGATVEDPPADEWAGA